MDSEGRLRTELYDKRDYFNFPIVNFLFICINIPSAPAYGVYISKLIRYSIACGSYQNFIDRGLLLTRKLLNQGSSWLNWSYHFESITVATMTWLTVMVYMCHKSPRICSTCREHFPVLSSFMTYHRVCNYINTTGATSGAGTACPSGAPEFTLGFSGVRVTRSLVLCVCFVDGCLSFCPYYLSHCVVCPTSIYWFWLPLWYIQNLTLTPCPS